MGNRGLSFRLRLTILFTVLSILGMTLLFVLTFFSLYRTLRSEDLDEMRSGLLGYWAQFQTGGFDLLQEEIRLDNLVSGERPFAVRVADRENRTILYSYPEFWSSFGFDRLELYDLSAEQILVLGSPDVDYTIEIGGLWLSNDYYLQLGLATSTRERLLTLFRRNYLTIAGGVVVLGFVLGLFAASRALSPVAHVNQTVREIIDTGRLSSRVPEPGGAGELVEMTRLFNRMLERLEKLVDGMRSTVDMVAHDLRTPVTRLHATAELALSGDNPDELRHALEEAQQQSTGILSLVNTLLEITRAESGVIDLRLQEVNVAEVFSCVCDVYELVAEERGVALVNHRRESLAVRADPVRLQQAVANLVDNAVKYTSAGGSVDLYGREGSGDDADMVILEVRDTGSGLTGDERDRVWDRMYRGPVQPIAQQQPGLGLGLSFVKAIVEAHQGRVAVESIPGSGSVFRIILPGKGAIS